MHGTFAWFADKGVVVVGPLFLVTYGLVTVIRPDVILRWIRRAHPDRQIGGPAIESFVRALGALVCALALVALLSL